VGPVTAPFVHLHLHTEYSIVDGLIQIEPLVEQVAAKGMPAVAVTDQSALFAVVKLYRAALERGIKPIIGADLWLANGTQPAKRSRLVLLCQDLGGYRNLSRLVTKSYSQGQSGGGVPTVSRDWLEGATEGLIALSGGREGDIGQALLSGNTDEAKALLCGWLERFPDRFYLELSRTGRPDEGTYIDAAVELALACDAPVVATNDVRFLLPADYEAHEARVCIYKGCTLSDPERPRRYRPEQYLRDAKEMSTLFADLPEAIDNSGLIAQRCNLELRFDQYYLPEFPVPSEQTLDGWFREQTRAGLEARLRVLFDRHAPEFQSQRQAYDQRLETELQVISRMGFAGYFLIVADFIRWAKAQQIPVGPGRGSGAGSLAAYALGITDLDPLHYDLLFERFLNPERVSMPDFDVDFCMDRRDEVIDYVGRRYGRDRVAQIITYGTLAAKAVVRDVGRVLGYPYGVVDKLAKLIPFELNMTLDRAFAAEPALRERYDKEEEVRTLIDLARKLEGLTRNAGKHAGGVVIAPSPLTDFMPLYQEQGAATPVTQFDMGDVEAIGLVKFDFLGLRTLTILDWAVRGINRIRAERDEEALDIACIPLDDPATFGLIQGARTTAVFQLESRGMKDLIKRLAPDVFEDLIALVALFRPGPLQSGMVDDFINRKHGHAKVTYPHPELEPILKPTYGVILYQEQVMSIAQVLAGYTLGAADLLRRAMGKKKPQEMAKQRAVFLEGAGKRGVDADKSGYIFDLMEKFAGYGFNRSHSAAYALISYQTAWLKAHYPAAFMAAVLSSDMDHTDKVVALIEECRRMSMAVLPPDLTTCDYRFTVADDNSIHYGLGAIKGVGAAAIEALTSERKQQGPFQDLFELCRRVDLKKVNRRALEALIRAGALDKLGPGRSAMMATLEHALQLAEQRTKNSAFGQDDLFGLGAPSDAQKERERTAGLAFVDAPEWSEQERLAGEKETLGLYLTGHPVSAYEAELKPLITTELADLKSGTQRIGGLVAGLRTNTSKRGRMAVATLEDGSGRVEVVIYAETLQKYTELLAKDRLLIVEGECNIDELSGGLSLVAERIFDLDGARQAFAKRLVLRVDSVQVANGFIPELKDILDSYRRGPCLVAIDYHQPGAYACLTLGQDWRVYPTGALLDSLRSVLGEDCVRLEY
jgi:DNA polymerase-3 subunit alpha